MGKLKQLDDNMAVEVNQLLNTETEDVALIGTSREFIVFGGTGGLLKGAINVYIGTEMKQRKKQTRQRGKVL